jgi:hypothetical protein
MNNFGQGLLSGLGQGLDSLVGSLAAFFGGAFAPVGRFLDWLTTGPGMIAAAAVVVLLVVLLRGSLRRR